MRERGNAIPEVRHEVFRQQIESIIDHKLHLDDAFLPKVVYPTDKAAPLNTRIARLKERVGVAKGNDDSTVVKDMESDLASKAVVERKSSDIKNLAASLLSQIPENLVPDDLYLSQLADLAIDYYQKNWHEQIDDAHSAQHQADWKSAIGNKMSALNQQLDGRKATK